MSIRWIGSSLSAMAPAARSYSLFPGHTQQAALCRSMLRSGSHEVGTPALELSLQNNSMIGISFDCFGSPRRATTTTYMDGLGRRLTLSLSLQPPSGGSLGAAAWDQHNMHMHMHLRIHLSSFTLTLTFTHCHHAPATFSPPRCHRLTNQPTNETKRNERRAPRRTRWRCQCRDGRVAAHSTTTTTTPPPSSQPSSFHLARSSCPAALCLRVSLRVAPFRALRCPPASSDPCLPGTACPAHNTTLTLPSTIPLSFGKILIILPGSSLPARQPACRALPGTLPTGLIGPLLARDGLSTTPHNLHNSIRRPSPCLLHTTFSPHGCVLPLQPHVMHLPA